MTTTAIVLEEPGQVALSELVLQEPGVEDVVVEITASGISTGTEKLFWTGRMPPFPGMGYPLVPGYESVGDVVEAGPQSGLKVGDHVFVPGADCYGNVRGLFGGSARRVVTPGSRVTRVDRGLGDEGALLALAATARHAIAGLRTELPELIVGHGVLGRLLARLTVAAGGTPVVWEVSPDRMGGAEGYEVIHPEKDSHRAYETIFDASGRADLLPELISRITKGGEIVLAGFYEDPISFAFPPAFMKEARLRVSAEWAPADMQVTRALVESGALSLTGLISVTRPAADAASAYATAFDDPTCLKLVLDWRDVA
ncbi:chlorophyll synthesis pathway protein BchC [Palleronia caenipelagi]|uniref:Chlorophyll synthesis pathway protein BchC n=1 Tax=Palleronia caenipelagi TaxID=2489174 RepID=A0A547Q7Y5_9RHOB|nr:chlorophyll synthesis pathway protein BchC [Palleronia caenipelagi]TRD22486.1 chlorophyll synthesis pathway protein BchC [Palleronia caenipelagi]